MFGHQPQHGSGAGQVFLIGDPARTTAIDHLEAELDRQITRSNRLRQSTLASAFSGKLVAQDSTPLAKKNLPEDLFPDLPSTQKKTTRKKAPKTTSTTDLHAGPIALAIRAHQKTSDHLGHVKAEKSTHLCDGIFRLHLERTPTNYRLKKNLCRQ